MRWPIQIEGDPGVIYRAYTAQLMIDVTSFKDQNAIGRSEADNRGR